MAAGNTRDYPPDKQVKPMKSHLKNTAASFVVLACLPGVGLVASGSANAADCAAGDPKLPHSGLCTSQVKHLLPAPSEDFLLGLEISGCKVAVSDGNILGHTMIYWAAQCQGTPAKLEGGMGAHSGSLDVWGGGMYADDINDPVKVATILASEPKDPTSGMMRWIREGMKADGYDAAAIAKCAPRKEPMFGPDALVVDEFAAGKVPVSSGGPRSACGSYGYTEESHAYWRVVHGLAFHFDLGQDAYKDIDPNSLIILDKIEKGIRPVGDVMADVRAYDTSSGAGSQPSGGTAATIAEMAGAQETAYGETRGWTIVSGAVGGAFSYCAGENTINGIKVRLGGRDGNWQIGINSVFPADYNGQFVVDDQTWNMTGTATQNWTIGRIDEAALNAIGQGNLMILDIGRVSFDFPLVGTAATILKVKECVQRNQS